MSKLNKRNKMTGMPQKELSGDETNAMTGMPITKQSGSDDGDGAKWPTISDLSKRKDPEPKPKPVQKGSGNWPSLTCQLIDKDVSKSISKSGDFQLNIPIFAAVEKAADEHIAYGIVYEPDEVDAQGDQASEDEIRKAAYHFMENNPTFKIMHTGKARKVTVLENYIAPQDLTVEDREIKKGSWVMALRILDKKMWAGVKSGKLTGLSMAGYAKVESDKQEN